MVLPPLKSCRRFGIGIAMGDMLGAGAATRPREPARMKCFKSIELHMHLVVGFRVEAPPSCFRQIMNQNHGVGKLALITVKI